jgi:transmembrane sensor
MSEVIKLPTNSQLEEEAAAWIWRLDAETVTAADRQDFEAWLRRDVRHRRAYGEFDRLWRRLDDLGEAKRPEKIATFTLPPAEQLGFRVPLAWAVGIAATVLVAVAAMLWLPRGATAETVATAVGQQRTVTLADRSVVTLNTNTIIETRFGSGIRDVYLRKGEAHFVVAHDGSRPFLVHAGDAVVHAVGTEFDVRIRDSRQVEVMVSEGRVEVQTAEPAVVGAGANTKKTVSQPARVLAANEWLTTGPTAMVVYVVSVEEVANTLAWRQGVVVFDGKPLSEAAAELSRYTDTRFVITDPSISRLPVRGRFKADDVKGFLTTLEKSFPVVARHAPDDLVYIEPRA